MKKSKRIAALVSALVMALPVSMPVMQFITTELVASAADTADCSIESYGTKYSKFYNEVVQNSLCWNMTSEKKTDTVSSVKVKVERGKDPAPAAIAVMDNKFEYASGVLKAVVARPETIIYNGEETTDGTTFEIYSVSCRMYEETWAHKEHIEGLNERGSLFRPEEYTAKADGDNLTLTSKTEILTFKRVEEGNIAGFLKSYATATRDTEEAAIKSAQLAAAKQSKAYLKTLDKNAESFAMHGETLVRRYNDLDPDMQLNTYEADTTTKQKGTSYIAEATFSLCHYLEDKYELVKIVKADGSMWGSQDTTTQTTEPTESTEPVVIAPGTPTVPGYPNIVLGDATDDGKTDIMDVIRMNKFLLGAGRLSESGHIAVDFNKNGADSTDALNLLKYIVNILTAKDLYKLDKNYQPETTETGDSKNVPFSPGKTVSEEDYGILESRVYSYYDKDSNEIKTTHQTFGAYTAVLLDESGAVLKRIDECMVKDGMEVSIDNYDSSKPYYLLTKSFGTETSSVSPLSDRVDTNKKSQSVANEGVLSAEAYTVFKLNNKTSDWEFYRLADDEYKSFDSKAVPGAVIAHSPKKVTFRPESVNLKYNFLENAINDGSISTQCGTYYIYDQLITTQGHGFYLNEEALHPDSHANQGKDTFEFTLADNEHAYVIYKFEDPKRKYGNLISLIYDISLDKDGRPIATDYVLNNNGKDVRESMIENYYEGSSAFIPVLIDGSITGFTTENTTDTQNLSSVEKVDIEKIEITCAGETIYSNTAAITIREGYNDEATIPLHTSYDPAQYYTIHFTGKVTTHSGETIDAEIVGNLEPNRTYSPFVMNGAKVSNNCWIYTKSFKEERTPETFTAGFNVEKSDYDTVLFGDRFYNHGDGYIDLKGSEGDSSAIPCVHAPMLVIGKNFNSDDFIPVDNLQNLFGEKKYADYKDQDIYLYFSAEGVYYKTTTSGVTNTKNETVIATKDSKKRVYYFFHWNPELKKWEAINEVLRDLDSPEPFKEILEKGFGGAPYPNIEQETFDGISISKYEILDLYKSKEAGEGLDALYCSYAAATSGINRLTLDETKVVKLTWNELKQMSKMDANSGFSIGKDYYFVGKVQGKDTEAIFIYNPTTQKFEKVTEKNRFMTK